MIPHAVILALNYSPDESGPNFLDEKIEWCRTHRFRPVIAVGQNGDAILRSSRKLMDFPFIFDPSNGTNAKQLLQSAAKMLRTPFCLVQLRGELSAESLRSEIECEIQNPSRSPEWMRPVGPNACIVTRSGIDLLLRPTTADLDLFPFVFPAA